MASLVVYLAFVGTQTIRHRDYFLPTDADGETIPDHDPEEDRAAPRSGDRADGAAAGEAVRAVRAVRAARCNRVQTGLNLGYGSAMASIGLTIPVIAVATIWLDGPLKLGLDPTHMVLLALTFVIGTLTVVPGRATLLQGGLHLTVFAAFLVLAVSP